MLCPHHAKNGKKPEINKQSNINFWLNQLKYGAVSYSLSYKITEESTKHHWFFAEFFKQVPAVFSTQYTTQPCIKTFIRPLKG